MLVEQGTKQLTKYDESDIQSYIFASYVRVVTQSVKLINFPFLLLYFASNVIWAKNIVMFKNIVVFSNSQWFQGNSNEVVRKYLSSILDLWETAHKKWLSEELNY